MTITIYEPAMCCSTGLCGVDVDVQLVTFAADSAWAQQQGIAIQRFNLSQQPMEFATQPTVNAFLQQAGAEGLPIVLVDGAIAVAGRYPTRTELAQWAPHRQAVPLIMLNQTASAGCADENCSC